MANRYFVGTGNWNDTSKWSLTSGGTTGVAVPTTSDIVYFDDNTVAVTIPITNAVCQQYLEQDTFVGSVTISGTNKVTISGNTRLSANASHLGDGYFSLGTTTKGDITTNNVTIPWILQGAGTGAKTWLGNLTCDRIMLSSSVTWNGYVISSLNGLRSDSMSRRILYGSSEIWIQGGEWNYVLKRNGGKIVIDGDIISSGSSASSSGIYDSDLAYNSGSFTCTGVFSFGGTSSVTIPIDYCTFDDIDASGTTTINQDIKLTGSLQCAGAVTFTLNGSGYSAYVGEHLIMYNLGTFIGTANIVMNGTGEVFRPTSLNGMPFNALSPLQINLIIDTTGTITFVNLPAYNQFGGGKTLTYIAGTVVTTGCTFQVATGGYSFDIDNGFTVPTLMVGKKEGEDGIEASFLSGFTCGAYLQYVLSTTTISENKKLTATTSFIINGRTDGNTNFQRSGTARGLLEYQGTQENLKIFNAIMTSIDASSSSDPIYNWHGTVTDCINVTAIPPLPAGGGGSLAITII